VLHDLQGLGSLTTIWRSLSDTWDKRDPYDKRLIKAIIIKLLGKENNEACKRCVERKGLFSATHLLKVRWMITVLITRNLMPALNVMCLIVIPCVTERKPYCG
jgi:hypothetical protein